MKYYILQNHCVTKQTPFKNFNFAWELHIKTHLHFWGGGSFNQPKKAFIGLKGCKQSSFYKISKDYFCLKPKVIKFLLT